MEAVIAAILARGEAAILHTYPENPAVALYRALGFERRQAMTYVTFSRASDFSR